MCEQLCMGGKGRLNTTATGCHAPGCPLAGRWLYGRRLRQVKALVTLAVVAALFILIEMALTSTYIRDSKYLYNAERRYLLQTSTCGIPDFDISHPSVARFRAEVPKKINCWSRRPLTEARGLTILLYKDRVKDYHVTQDNLTCVYQGIERLEQDPHNFTIDCDRQFRLKDMVSLESPRTVTEEDGVFVTCSRNNATVYKNIHYFIQPRRSLAKRTTFWKEHSVRGRERPSVLIMGVDSVSRANMRRNMPRTFSFLKHQLGALDFQAFNKVADNTNPNMVATLMGLKSDELRQTCQPHLTKYDDCPLIWKNFSNSGYITVYGEDTPYDGTFHYKRFGFVEEPTDYYNRPYMLAAEKHIKHSPCTPKAYPCCLGFNTSMEVIHDYSLSMAEALKNIPYFAYYWSTAMTHENVEWASAADEPSLEYLKKLNQSGVLDHTILFFISDHGMRFGNIRSTYAGKLEEMLPYFFVLFPPWFKEQHTQAWNNLNINTKRLVSNFDVHVTLRDILEGVYGDSSARLPPLTHGRSLFEEIPMNRTCEDATIPDHYCTCEHSSQVDSHDMRLHQAAQFVVEQLNSGLASYPDCVQLHMDQVVRGEEWASHQDNATGVTVVFSTTPGSGLLEATMRLRSGQFDMAADVSRINKYGNQSHCISDPFYARYCYCKELLTTAT